MKKTKIYFLLFVLAAAFTINSCKKEEKKPVNCDELYTNYYNAVSAFSMNPTEANCIAFEKAINDLVKGCAILSPLEKQQFQEALDDNDCSEFNTGK